MWRLLIPLVFLVAHSLNAQIKPLIALSIPPQEELIRTLAGDLVETFVLVDTQTNPHTYTPLPNQILQMRKATAFLGIGMEFEEAWEARFRAENRALKIIPTDRGITKLSYTQKPNYNYDSYYDDYYPPRRPHFSPKERQERGNMPNDPDIYWENFDRESYPKHRPPQRPPYPHNDNNGYYPPHDQGYYPNYPNPNYPHYDRPPRKHRYYNQDTHLWLSPTNYEKIALNTLNVLLQLLPSQEILLRNNFEKLQQSIRTTQMRIKESLANVPRGAKFMIYHPALAYFAKEYDLVQMAIEAEELNAVINAALRENINLILQQPEFSQREVRILAEELRAKVVTFSSLETPWADNLTTLAKELGTALQQ